MAKQADEAIDECRDGDAALLVLIGEQRDELHRFAAEVAEDMTTPDRHLEVAEGLCRLSQQLGSRAHRITIRQRAPRAVTPDEEIRTAVASLLTARLLASALGLPGIGETSMRMTAHRELFTESDRRGRTLDRFATARVANSSCCTSPDVGSDAP